MNTTILVGTKPLMNYVTGVVMQFTTQNVPEVTVRARGKFVSRAVDVVEVARKRFLNELVDIKDIRLGSEEFQSEGRVIRVSTIEICLKRKE